MSGSKTKEVRDCLICADDFAHTPQTSAEIIALLDAGYLNATTCLVESPSWGEDSARLRSLARESAIAVGLHLNLTERLGGETVSTARLAFDHSRALEAQISQRFKHQWDAFVQAMQAPPDFIDGHLHVHLAPAARAALFELAEAVSFRGWLRQCRSSKERHISKRFVLDAMSDAFSAEARLRGFACNPGFGGLRRFRLDEDVEALWRSDLGAMAEGGLLMVHPGAQSSGDAIGACRDQEARALPGLHASLSSLGFAMAPDPRQPW